MLATVVERARGECDDYEPSAAVEAAARGLPASVAAAALRLWSLRTAPPRTSWSTTADGWGDEPSLLAVAAGSELAPSTLAAVRSVSLAALSATPACAAAPLLLLSLILYDVNVLHCCEGFPFVIFA